jgi:alkylation response protein AidB-like acyl-CoA dehydrogenase
VAEKAQLNLQQVASWDRLGMRGTCSETHRLVADTAPERLLPVPYAVMSAETMLPTSHITWAALKTGTSTMAVQVSGQAMLVAGLSGYRNNTPYSLGRHLRDAHSAALMISNDRILGNSAALLTADRSDERLFAWAMPPLA